MATLLFYGDRGDSVKQTLYALLSRVSLFLATVVIRVYSRFVVVECTEVFKLLFLLSLLFAHYVFLVLREDPLLLLPLLLKFDPLSLLLEFDLPM